MNAGGGEQEDVAVGEQGGQFVGLEEAVDDPNPARFEDAVELRIALILRNLRGGGNDAGT